MLSFLHTLFIHLMFVGVFSIEFFPSLYILINSSHVGRDWFESFANIACVPSIVCIRIKLLISRTAWVPQPHIVCVSPLECISITIFVPLPLGFKGSGCSSIYTRISSGGMLTWFIVTVRKVFPDSRVIDFYSCNSCKYCKYCNPVNTVDR